MAANFNYRITLNTKAITRPATQAFVQYTRILYNQFTEEFADSKWTWPRETRRMNGEIAGQVRNIIDTGKLLNSQKLSYKYGETTAVYSWDTPYAMAVLKGFRTSRGREYRGRDWVGWGIAAKPPAQYIAQALRGNWS